MRGQLYYLKIKAMFSFIPKGMERDATFIESHNVIDGEVFSRIKYVYHIKIHCFVFKIFGCIMLKQNKKPIIRYFGLWLLIFFLLISEVLEM
jgi:hypothetical protein